MKAHAVCVCVMCVPSSVRQFKKRAKFGEQMTCLLRLGQEEDIKKGVNSSVRGSFLFSGWRR